MIFEKNWKIKINITEDENEFKKYDNGIKIMNYETSKKENKLIITTKPNKNIYEIIEKEKLSNINIYHKNKIKFKNIKEISLSILTNKNNFLIILKEFLLNNPELNNKEITLNNNISFDKYTFNILKNNFNNVSNIYIKINNSIKKMTIKDFEETFNRINLEVEEIKNKNYSPIEKLIATYDFVRKKKCENEKINKTLNNTKKIENNKPFYTEYINLFVCIANKLGIPSYFSKATYDNKDNDKIAIASSYIIDYKYNFKGVLFFDPAFDFEDKDNIFSDSYMYFGKNREEIKTLYKNKIKLEDIDDAFENALILKEINKNYNWQSIKKINLYSLFVSLKHTPFFNCALDPYCYGKLSIIKGHLEDNENLLKNYSLRKIIEVLIKSTTKINEFINLSSQTLPIDILANALFEVKKDEYLKNKNEYILSLKHFKQILQNSTINHKDNIIKLSIELGIPINVIINNDHNINTTNEQIEEFIKKEKIEEKIKKLTN